MEKKTGSELWSIYIHMCLLMLSVSTLPRSSCPASPTSLPTSCQPLLSCRHFNFHFHSLWTYMVLFDFIQSIGNHKQKGRQPQTRVDIWYSSFWDWLNLLHVIFFTHFPVNDNFVLLYGWTFPLHEYVNHIFLPSSFAGHVLVPLLCYCEWCRSKHWWASIPKMLTWSPPGKSPAVV